MSELDKLITELRERVNFGPLGPVDVYLLRALDALELARSQRNKETYDYAWTVDYVTDPDTLIQETQDDLDAQLAAALRGQK